MQQIPTSIIACNQQVNIDEHREHHHSNLTNFSDNICVCVRACVCAIERDRDGLSVLYVCVCERQREKASRARVHGE